MNVKLLIKQHTPDEGFHFHHFNLTFNSREVVRRFRDVRIVLMSGCRQRALNQAMYLFEKFNHGSEKGKYPCEILTFPDSRFSLYKLGSVLVCDHGIGPASISVALNEIIMMCRKAEVYGSKLTIIRFGTCGGIGVDTGTVCVTNKAIDPMFKSEVEMKICGQRITRQARFDLETANQILKLANDNLDQDHLGYYEVKIGTTVTTNDFYEEQGRLVGAICEPDENDKRLFLHSLETNKVINIEMEALTLAAVCSPLGIRHACICVALTNRVATDLIRVKARNKSLYEERLFWINYLFIKEKLSAPAPEPSGSIPV